MTTLQEGSFSIHNAVAEPHPLYPGHLLSRYPTEVRNQMNPGARLKGADCTMAEIRFVTPAPTVRVLLSNLDGTETVRVFRGVFEHSEHRIPVGGPTLLTLDSPAFVERAAKESLHLGGWSPDVWRIVFDRAQIGIHGVDTLGHPLRAPESTETPALRWLAYGSSITHSTFFSYTGFAARELGVDVFNKGLGGSCHVEPVAADFFGSIDWDFATLELGVNLRSIPEAESFFEKRVRYLLEALRRKHPVQPIALITIFPNRDKGFGESDPEIVRRQTFFDETLRRIHRESNDPNLHLIEGNQIVKDATYLGTDLLHPPPHGSARMGANLAALLRPILVQ